MVISFDCQFRLSPKIYWIRGKINTNDLSKSKRPKANKHTQKREKIYWRLQKSSVGLIKWKIKKTWQKPSVKEFIMWIGVDWLNNINRLNNELNSEKCETKLKKFRICTYILWWQNVGQHIIGFFTRDTIVYIEFH